ncbi:MAG TPA: phage holin family protein [Bacillota bacterium]|nr:phage holin family protein [Bacillota bacterium]
MPDCAAFFKPAKGLLILFRMPGCCAQVDIEHNTSDGKEGQENQPDEVDDQHEGRGRVQGRKEESRRDDEARRNHKGKGCEGEYPPPAAPYKPFAGIGGGIASFLFGGWDLSLTALALMMAFDYVTGFLAAAKEGKLNSNVGFWGIVRKAGTFIVVSAIYWMALNALPDAKQAVAVRDGVAIAFFFTEGVSVIENCGRLGVKIHPIVRQAVNQLRQKGEEKNGGQNLS